VRIVALLAGCDDHSLFSYTSALARAPERARYYVAMSMRSEISSQFIAMIYLQAYISNHTEIDQI
jgi:hypothetical protein